MGAGARAGCRQVVDSARGVAHAPAPGVTRPPAHAPERGTASGAAALAPRHPWLLRARPGRKGASAVAWRVSMSYVAVEVEGGLFPADLLDRIAAGEAAGQTAADFGLSGGHLSDEI